MLIAKFEFALKTENSFGLPSYKGSTFRGKFGHVLKRTICLMNDTCCDGCQLRNKCVYPYLFETQSDSKQSVPRPFIIEPPLLRKRFFLKDETLYVNLILIGRAIDYLTYFIHVFDRMGKEGIGRDRGKFRIESVKAIDESGSRKEIFSPSHAGIEKSFQRINLNRLTGEVIPQVTLKFLTPTQLQKKGRVQELPDFELLLKSILRRFHSLNYFHGDGLKERFAINWNEVRTIRTLHTEGALVQLKRYSNRQGRPVIHKGYLGKITYQGDLSTFYPWLKIGEFVHVGKGTVFGMGKYKIA